MAESMRIIGVNKIDGRQFKKIKVLGECNLLNSVNIDKLSVLGNLIGEHDVKAKKLWVFGIASFKKLVTASKIKISGTANFSEGVKSKNILIHGTMDVKGKVEADIFKSKGSFNLMSLNAESIKIIPGGSCEVQEIGAGSVRVLQKGHSKDYWYILNTLFPVYHKVVAGTEKLKAELIEADDIYIENTVAGIVRGKNVCVGPGCKIEQVEYSNNYQGNDDAVIGKIIQI